MLGWLCFCGGVFGLVVVLFLCFWDCVFVVVWLCLCFCVFVAVWLWFLCWYGFVFVVFFWWCGCVFVGLCFDVFVVCFCGGRAVF